MANTTEPTESTSDPDNMFISPPTPPPPSPPRPLPNELLLLIISHTDPLTSYFHLRLASPLLASLVHHHFRITYLPLMASLTLSLRTTFISYAQPCLRGTCAICLTGHGNDLAPFTFHRVEGDTMVLRQARVERWNHRWWGYTAGDLRSVEGALKQDAGWEALGFRWVSDPSRVRCIWHFAHRHVSLFPLLPAEYRVLGFKLDPGRREVSVKWMVLAAVAFNRGNEGGVVRRPFPGGCYADGVFNGENCYSRVGYEWEGELQVWRGKGEVLRWEGEVKFPCERRPLEVVMARYVVLGAVVAGCVGFGFWARCARGVWKVVRWGGWL